MMQAQLEEMENIHQENIEALMKSHLEELEIIAKRTEETERVFWSYREQISQNLEELTRIKSENTALKSKLKEQKNGPVSESALREEKLVYI